MDGSIIFNGLIFLILTMGPSLEFLDPSGSIGKLSQLLKLQFSIISIRLSHQGPTCGVSHSVELERAPRICIWNKFMMLVWGLHYQFGVEFGSFFLYMAIQIFIRHTCWEPNCMNLITCHIFLLFFVYWDILVFVLILLFYVGGGGEC